MEQMMGREGELVLVNGQAAPRLEGHAGERERWRIIDACTSRYLALNLPDQDSSVVGRDQGRLAEPAALGDLVLAPGNRLDLLVDLREGSSELIARPVDRGGMMGGMMGRGRARAIGAVARGCRGSSRSSRDPSGSRPARSASSRGRPAPVDHLRDGHGWDDGAQWPDHGACPVEDFGGKTVYHCHILDHEDLVMMATVLAR
jgi:FtsP/CotA-like multicopper oxidase with cupredoxin domain